MSIEQIVENRIIKVSVQESGLSSANKALSETQKLLDRVANATGGMDNAFGRAAGNVASAAGVMVNGLQGVTGALTALDSGKKAVKAAMDTKAAAFIKDTAKTVKNTAEIAKNTAAERLSEAQKRLSAKSKNLSAAATTKMDIAQNKLRVTTKKGKVATLLHAAALKIAAIATGGAAVAVKVLAGAIKFLLGPIGLILIALALLTAAVVAIVNFFRSGSAAARENAAALEEHQEAAARSAEESERTQLALQNQADSANRLTDELEALSREENKSAEQKERMQAIVDQLNGSYDGLNLAIDEEGNLLGKSTDALRDYISARQNSGNFENAQRRRNELESQHIDLLDGQRRAQAEVDRLRRSGASENSARMQNALATLDGFNDALAENNAQFQAYNDTLQRSFTSSGDSIETLAATWNMTVDEVEAAMDRYGFTLDDMVDHQTQGLNDLADQWGMSVDEIKAEMERYGLSQAEWSANQDAAWAQTQADISRHTGNMINGFREIPSSLGKSHEDVAAMLAENRRIYNEWSQNIQDISADVSDGVMAELENLGTAGHQLLYDALHGDADASAAAWAVIYEMEAAVVDATHHAEGTMPDYGERAADAYYEGLEDADLDEDTFVEPVENAAEATIEVAHEGGYAAGEAYVEGVEEALEAVDFTPVAAEMDKATKKMEESASDSMQSIENIFKTSLKASEGHVERAFDSIYGKMIASMSRMVTGAAFRASQIVTAFGRLHGQLNAAGVTSMVGFRNGMLSQERSILDNARRIAAGVQNAFRVTLRINSPSRVLMKLGRGTMSGFALGMERMQSRVENVVRNTSRAIQEGLTKTLNEGRIEQKLNISVGPADGRQNSLMERLIDAVEAGKHIILDTGELVGATAGQYDHAHGVAVSYNDRWGR